MILPILLVVLVLLLAVVAVAVWFIRKRSQLVKPMVAPPSRQVSPADTVIKFRWRYLALPLLLLLVTVAMVAFFYPRLPAGVAYHFEPDGSGDRWLGRGWLVLWLLGGQLFLSLLAVIVVWGIVKMGVLFRQPQRTQQVNPESVVSLMGNMVALPQVILAFAMLDIFSYNSYQVHILPLWVIAVIVMLLGAVIMGGLFIRVLQRSLAKQGQGR